MKRIDRFAQIISIEMGIDLGGGDGRMAEHLLHSAQIGATFDEMRGEGMAEAVR